MSKKNKMNWTILFIIVAGLSALAAAILQYRENDVLAKENMRLQNELLKYATGGDGIPAILTMPTKEQITFSILSIDKYPMLNVRAKCNEQPIPDIGTLYPNVVTQFFSLPIPLNEKTKLCDFIIWYNNTKSIGVEVYVSRGKDGFLRESKIRYLDSKGTEFTHPWQGRPK